MISGELSTGALISFVLYVSNIGASLATLAGLFSSVMEVSRCEKMLSESAILLVSDDG